MSMTPTHSPLKRALWCATAAAVIGIGAIVGAQDNKPAADQKPADNALANLKPNEAVTTASGLKVTMTAEPKDSGAKVGDIVWVHYTGKLQANGEQFDSSVGGRPFKLTLGQGEVIAGWDEGLVGMKLGEKRQLVIPAALGYKERGSPPKIPPNATLVFDVELISIARPG